MKYLTIKNTRAILIRYVLFIFISWTALIFVFDGKEFIIDLFNYPVQLKIFRPSFVAIGAMLLTTFIVAHALSYRLSRWINNGKGGLVAGLKAVFYSWSLPSLILLYITARFSITHYVVAVSLLPLILAAPLSWELKRASRIK